MSSSPGEAPPAAAQAPPRPPASAAAAIGIMVGVAVIAVALIIGWVRLGGPGSAGPRALGAIEDEVPVRLADGRSIPDAPPELAAAFDEPVIAAVILSGLPDGLGRCDDWGHTWDREPEFQHAILTPDSVTAVFAGTGWQDFGGPMPAAAEEVAGEPEEIRVVCDGTPVEGGWAVQTATVEVGPADATLRQGMGWSCCDADGRSAVSAAVQAPRGAAWAVQERGAYWLAYPVADDGTARVGWRFRDSGFGGGPGASHLVFVDAEGAILDETYLRP